MRHRERAARLYRRTSVTLFLATASRLSVERTPFQATTLGLRSVLSSSLTTSVGFTAPMDNSRVRPGLCGARHQLRQPTLLTQSSLPLSVVSHWFACSILSQVPTWTNFTRLTCNSNFACALDIGGRWSCFGDPGGAGSAGVFAAVEASPSAYSAIAGDESGWGCVLGVAPGPPTCEDLALRSL